MQDDTDDPETKPRRNDDDKIPEPQRRLLLYETIYIGIPDIVSREPVTPVYEYRNAEEAACIQDDRHYMDEHIDDIGQVIHGGHLVLLDGNGYLTGSAYLIMGCGGRLQFYDMLTGFQVFYNE